MPGPEARTQRAKQSREQAARLREIAQTAVGSTRQELLDLAAQFERLADSILEGRF
jgi:hypothetical protein